MLCLRQTHNPCMHSRASQICLSEGESLKAQNPKVDCQNPQLQGNLTMKAEIRVFGGTRSLRLGILRGAQLEQWMLEELGSLEFCKCSWACLKGYLRKAYSEILDPFCKAEDFSKDWWSYMTELFWATNLRDSKLCCLGLIYGHIARGLEILL